MPETERLKVLSFPAMYAIWKSWSTGTKIGAVIGGLGFLVGAFIGVAASGWIGVVMVLAFLGVFGAAFGYAYAPIVRRDQLSRKGVKAEATILSIDETGWTIQSNYGVARLHLEVDPADGSGRYETVTKAVIDRFDIPSFQPGERIAVLVDPRDRSKVAVDTG